MTIESKVVAITGISSGIGRALAEVFAGRGARVVGCARRADKGKKVESRIRETGGTFDFVQADITDKKACTDFIDAAMEKHGRIDVLINNAGAGGARVATDAIDEAEFDAVVRLNLYGALFCSQRAIHHMKSQGEGGLILSISSVQGVLAAANSAAYNAAKAGLIQLSNPENARVKSKEGRKTTE